MGELPRARIMLKRETDLIPIILGELKLIAPRYEVNVIHPDGNRKLEGYMTPEFIQSLVDGGSYKGCTVVIEPHTPRVRSN